MSSYLANRLAWAMETVKSRAFSERGGNGGDKRLRIAGVAVQAAGMLAVIKGGGFHLATGLFHPLQT